MAVLAVRNNNPGNLRAVGSSSGFRKFATPEEGLLAMRNDLLIKIRGNSAAMKAKWGNNYTPTFQRLIEVYAPSGDNNNPNSYANLVQKWSGIKPSQVLTENDVNKLIPAMIRVEGGMESLNYFTEPMKRVGILNQDGTPNADPNAVAQYDPTSTPSNNSPSSQQQAQQQKAQQQAQQQKAQQQAQQQAAQESAAREKLKAQIAEAEAREDLAEAEKEAAEARKDAAEKKAEVQRLLKELEEEKANNEDREKEKDENEKDPVETKEEEKDSDSDKKTYRPKFEKKDKDNTDAQNDSENNSTKEILSDLSGEKDLSALKILKIITDKAPLNGNQLNAIKKVLAKLSGYQGEEKEALYDNMDTDYTAFDNKGKYYGPPLKTVKFDQFVVEKINKLLPDLENKISNFIDDHYPNLGKANSAHMFTKIVEKNYAHIYDQVKMNYESAYGKLNQGDGGMKYKAVMKDIFTQDKDNLDHLLHQHGDHKPQNHKGGGHSHAHDNMFDDVFDMLDIDVPTNQDIV